MEDKVQQAIQGISNQVNVIVSHECANITTRIQVMLHELLKTYAVEFDKLAKELEEIKALIPKDNEVAKPGPDSHTPA